MNKRKCALTLLLLLLACTLFAQYQVDTVGLGWAQNSSNTAVFRKNSITTHNEHQFTAYYDSEGYVVLAKRAWGEKRWVKSRTPYRGNVKDAHNVISIATDGDGYLHVAWDHHDDSLHYARSKEPGSLELGAMTHMIGREEFSVTYPEFFKMPSGDLLFLYRDGRSGKGNLVVNYYTNNTQHWHRVHSNLIHGEGKRNAYWQAFVDAKGTIHLSWVWRESWDVASNHDLCYARSKDHGVTWEKISGEKYSLPITVATGDYAWRIPEGSELINQTSMFVDNRGRVYIASYWKPKAVTAPQYFLIWHNGKAWQERQVSQRTTDFSLSGGGTKKIPISRPQVMVTNNGIVHYIVRDAESGNKPCEYIGKLNDKKWEHHCIMPNDLGSWEPSYDLEAFRQYQIISLFVQRTGQGDGETLETIPPQAVMIVNNNGSK